MHLCGSLRKKSQKVNSRHAVRTGCSPSASLPKARRGRSPPRAGAVWNARSLRIPCAEGRCQFLRSTLK
ncbi:hypothetical protein [Lysobacter gummosus]|uniref:hypothetical protein n=1 Tax=Lysobacter gummosus TaxID=262324 RepID=UPI003627DAAE